MKHFQKSRKPLIGETKGLLNENRDIYPLNKKHFNLKAQSWDLSRSCYFYAKRISLLEV